MINFDSLLKSPAKLVHVPKSQDVVTFPQGLQGRAVFSPAYKHIEQVMKKIGLDVPVEKNLSQRKIYLEDAGFGTAFYELYFSQKMDPTIFVWQLVKK